MSSYLFLFLLFSNTIIQNPVIILLIKMYNYQATDIWLHRNVYLMTFFLVLKNPTFNNNY